MAGHNNFLLAMILGMCCTIINGLFTVEARTSHYIAEYGGNVSMECQFTLDPGTHVKNLQVLWKHNIDKLKSVEVVKYINGKDIEILQGTNYSARVKLLSNELHKGRAILHISNIKRTDAGQYSCIISSHGSDYKVINLDVQAPYKKIIKQVRNVFNSSGDAVKEVSCQSFGYPKAKVTWMVDKENLTEVYNISYTLTPDKLFNVTSVVRIPAKSNRALTCTFWNEISCNATSLTFNVSENSATERSQEWRLLFSSLAIIIVIVFLLAVVYVSGQWKMFYQKRAGFHDNICTNETSTSEYSTVNLRNNSEIIIIDAESTVTRLLNTS
ncbi:programmed cell death 1 ligand 1-like [Leptodactylus fuscus]|uniref:programmed cell death 1 ligand 1-like n=1 Tax=Leptodactylus fuscus TaxID=238119 RepID=UPI003F4EBE90